MAKKKVIWSKNAHNKRLKILEYWIERNQSKDYSEKLFALFQNASYLIGQYPKIGRSTDKPNVRIKRVRDYLLIYQIKEKHIEILVIWDSRDNPEKLKNELKK